MPLDINSYLGASPEALKVSARRTEVLAANLANADTPNYKARDIDFRAAMAAAAGGTGSSDTVVMKTTNTAHIGDRAASDDRAVSEGIPGSASGATWEGTPGGGATSSAGGATNAPLLYRVPLAPSLDGNTVDAQLEQASFAQNAVRYQATLTFLNAKFRSLLTAITGQ